MIYSSRRNGGQLAVFSVPIRGGTNIQLNQLGPSVSDFALSQDGNAVVFVTELGATGMLISVPVSGGVNTPLFSVQNHRVSAGGLEITPDSRYVLYEANIDRQDTFELFRSTIGVSNSQIKLHPDSAQGKSVLAGSKPIVSQDSQHVAYVSEFNFDEVHEGLYAPITGGPRRFLNPLSFALITNGIIPILNIEFSPDSTNIIYIAGIQRSSAPGGRKESLFFLPVGNEDPASVVQVNTNLPFGSYVNSARISDDSRYIVYEADQDVSGDKELYSVKINPIADELCFPIKTQRGAAVVVCL